MKCPVCQKKAELVETTIKTVAKGRLYSEMPAIIAECCAKIYIDLDLLKSTVEVGMKKMGIFE